MRFLFISLTFFHLLKVSSFHTHDVFFCADFTSVLCWLVSVEISSMFSLFKLFILPVGVFCLLLLTINYCWLLLTIDFDGCFWPIPLQSFHFLNCFFFVILASNQVQVVFSLFDFVFQIKFEEKLNQDFQQLVCRDVCYLNSVAAVWLRRAIGIMIAQHTGGNWLGCQIQT